MDCESGKIPNRDYMGNVIVDDVLVGKKKKKKKGRKTRERQRGERMDLTDEVRESLDETGQEGFDEALQFTSAGIFARIAAAVEDLLGDDQSEKERAEKMLIDCFQWKTCWFDEIFAKIVEILFGFKILLVMNVDKSDEDIFAAYHAAKRGDSNTNRPFWPYTEYVRGSAEVYDHFIILDNHCSRHFEVYFSNFYEKGIFTWDELVASPTLRVLFRPFIESESVRRRNRDLMLKQKKGQEDKETWKASSVAATGEQTGEEKRVGN